MVSTQPSADRIEQVAFGFMASKVLFGAIEFGVFTELAKGRLNAEDVRKRFGLHPRSIRDFLDTLVALGMLERSGEVYSNTTETDFYLGPCQTDIHRKPLRDVECTGLSVLGLTRRRTQDREASKRDQGRRRSFLHALSESGETASVPPFDDWPQ